MPEEHWLTFRSCVGKLLYLSPDRPDIQFVVQGLAVFMKEPTKKAWKGSSTSMHVPFRNQL